MTGMSMKHAELRRDCRIIDLAPEGSPRRNNSSTKRRNHAGNEAGGEPAVVWIGLSGDDAEASNQKTLIHTKQALGAS